VLQGLAHPTEDRCRFLRRVIAPAEKSKPCRPHLPSVRAFWKCGAKERDSPKGGVGKGAIGGTGGNIPCVIEYRTADPDYLRSKCVLGPTAWGMRLDRIYTCKWCSIGSLCKDWQSRLIWQNSEHPYRHEHRGWNFRVQVFEFSLSAVIESDFMSNTNKDVVRESCST